MAKYRVEYGVTQHYVGTIEIPDNVAPSDHACYVKYHLDSIKNEEPIVGEREVWVHNSWIEPQDGTEEEVS